MKIIVLSGHDFVGKTLVESLKNTDCDVYPLFRKDGLDLTDLNCTRKFFSEII